MYFGLRVARCSAGPPHKVTTERIWGRVACADPRPTALGRPSAHTMCAAPRRARPFPAPAVRPKRATTANRTTQIWENPESCRGSAPPRPRGPGTPPCTPPARFTRAPGAHTRPRCPPPLPARQTSRALLRRCVAVDSALESTILPPLPELN